MSRRQASVVSALVALCVVGAVSCSNAQSTEPATPTAPAGDAMVDAPWFDVSWPKVEMPKFAWKPWGGGEAAKPAADGNPIADTLDRVSSASGRAARSVREGWGSMMSKLPWGPGSAPPGSTASNDGPGFWSRMFSAGEPQGSQTVTEFLAQERVSQVR